MNKEGKNSNNEMDASIEKIASEVIKIKEKQKEQELKSPPLFGKHFFKNVWAIIINKKPENEEMLPLTLASLIQLFFNTIAVLCLLMCLISIGMIGYSLLTSLSIILALSCLLVAFISLLIALIMRGIANEMGREKDKNYIISVFSSLVGFVALIVALVALFKGVG